MKALTYVDCGGGYLHFEPTPATTYYILAISDLNISATWIVENATCNSPEISIDTGNGTGESQWGNNNCEPPDPLMPCQNAHVIYYSYTVGCINADLDIEVEPWHALNAPPPGIGVADEAGVMAMLCDCSTIMSSFDQVNGTGYVCSAMSGNEILSLSNVPAGMTILIAVGSGPSQPGYYEVFVQETPVAGGISNDICAGATMLNVGVNENLSNGCGTQDFAIPSCPAQSEATVWYSYDPTPNVEDITINLDPKSILGPAIAVYSDCSGGGYIDDICGQVLTVSCIDSPIFIQIGSTNNTSGAFSLEIETAPALIPPSLIVTSSDICSNDPANVQVTIPGGLIGDIFVEVHVNSSTDITGMMTQAFMGVNSVTVNDILVNCGTNLENAIYTVYALIPGFNCPSPPIDVTFGVSPKMISKPGDISDCLPYLVTLNASDYISGGTLPYLTYNWLWNGTNVIGVTETLPSYPISQSGTITLQVTDSAFCTEEATISITAHPLLNTILTSNQIEACPGDPFFITLTVSAISGGPIITNSWTIMDDQGVEVFIGNAIGNDLIIETELLSASVYDVFVESIDINGCMTTSNTIAFTILPTANGIINLISSANCQAELEIIFYDSNGDDIFNNGPDSNGDGIPDILDLNNDGIPDITDVIWTTPSGDVFNTGALSFIPTQSGIYTTEIITDQGCSIFMLIDAMIFQQNSPTITTSPSHCLGQSVTLYCEPNTYATYSWMDDGGMEIGTDDSIVVNPMSSPVMYILETVDANGCVSSEMITLILNASPDIQLTGSTSICPGEMTTVSVGDGMSNTYQWFDGSNMLLGSDSSTLVIDMAGDYSVVVTNDMGCADSLDFVIDENADLAIDIAGNDLCGNSTIALDGGPGFDSYLWLDANGDFLGDDQMLDINAQGTYFLQVALGNCTGMDSIDVLQFDAPVVDLISSLMICNNAGTQSVINFEDLVATSDNGMWMSLDLPSTILDDLIAVDFDMVGMGDYNFVFTTNVASPPCQDVMDTLLVQVSDCPCLNPEVMDQLVLCNSDDLFDLNTALLPTTDSGSWSFDSGPQMVVINGSTINIINLTTGIYDFVYTLDPLPSMGCQIDDTLAIEIVATPEVIFDTPSSLCNIPSMAASSMLDLGSLIQVGSGNWIDPNITNLDFSDPDDLNFVGVAPGTYSIEFLTNNASQPCLDIIYTINITVIDCNCPFIDLQSPGPVCNDSGVLDLTSYQGISDPGVWTVDPFNPEALTINNGQVDLTGALVGSYQFIYTLDNIQAGCPEFDQIVVQLFAPPEILSIEDAVVCNDNSTGGSTAVNLNDLIDAGPGVWTDSNGVIVSDPSEVDFAGLGIGNMFVYTFTTSTAIGPCDNMTASSIITIQDCSCDDPDFLDPPFLCNASGESIDLMELILSDHEGTWEIIDQPNGANAVLDQSIFVVEFVVAGDYELEYTLLNDPGPNCASTFTFDVTIFDQLVANVNPVGNVCTSNFNGESTSIDLGDQVVSSDGQGYWIDEDGMVITELNIDFLDAEAGDYLFTYILENEAPCVTHESQVILTADVCSRELVDEDIYIPNVFSPNADNLNDIFFLQSGDKDLIIRSLTIFDRWGERMFSLEEFPVNDPTYGWDGQFRGTYVEQGVYQYLIDVEEVDGAARVIAGDVTVLR